MSVDDTIIASDNDSFPMCCQAIIWNNDELLLIRPYETISSDISFQWVNWKCRLQNGGAYVSDSECYAYLSVYHIVKSKIQFRRL